MSVCHSSVQSPANNTKIHCRTETQLPVDGHVPFQTPNMHIEHRKRRVKSLLHCQEPMNTNRPACTIELQPHSSLGAEKMIPSFYQRKLPETCVAFASLEGKKIFSAAMANNGLKSFFLLIQQFTTQTEPAFCGLSTLVLVLNALGVDPLQNWKGPWRWYEESMLNCCLDLEDVKKKGITLKDFQCMAHCQGLSVDLTYHDDSKSNLDRFRRAVENACVEDTEDNSEKNMNPVDPTSVLVVSYCRKTLGQTGSGHFSPIAAFDKSSDSVLILDTARFKYGAHWAKLPLVYDAMEPVDDASGRSRGYALLSFLPSDLPTQDLEDSSTEGAVQPRSLLFRSKLTQHAARQNYKEYLAKRKEEMTWKEAVDYWVDPKSAVATVWSILEPLRLVPATALLSDGDASCSQELGEEQSSVLKLRSFLKELLQTVENGPVKCCDGSHPEKICVSDKEGLYLIYLASLTEERRAEIIRNHSSTGVSDLTKDQLLNEANLVAKAIEYSDQSTY